MPPNNSIIRKKLQWFTLLLINVCSVTKLRLIIFITLSKMYTTSFSVACLALSMACIVFPAQCFTAQKCLVKGQIGSQRQNGFSHIQIIDSSLHVSSEIGDASSPSIPNAGSSDSNQSKYGNDLPIPSSYVRCGRCQSLFALKPEDLGPKGKGRLVNQLENYNMFIIFFGFTYNCENSLNS